MKEILRSLRNKNNYSQSAVASYLDISRQMYNKYETGIAEPSLKNIKKLCELYKVSADIFLQNLNISTDDAAHYAYEPGDSSGMYVSEPAVPYGENAIRHNGNNLLAELIKLIPLLQLSEQISLMSRLASIIEKQACASDKAAIKTKKLKKIPDADYNRYLNADESKAMRNASLANIREILKNDEW